MAHAVREVGPGEDEDEVSKRGEAVAAAPKPSVLQLSSNLRNMKVGPPVCLCPS